MTRARRSISISAGAAAAALLLLARPAGAGIGAERVDVFVSDAESWGLQGDPNNTVLSLNLGAGSTITGLGWDVTIATAIDETRFSDLQFRFAYSSGADAGLTLTPGFGVDESGTMSFASEDVLDLTDNGLPNITLADGILLIEVLERQDDRPGDVDAFVSGVLTLEGFFSVAPPAPGTAGLLIVAGVAGLRRRR